jgi:23S rRNA A1618 N6-methylase RlmF
VHVHETDASITCKQRNCSPHTEVFVSSSLQYLIMHTIWYASHCQKQIFMIHSSLTNVIKLSNEDRLSRFHECGGNIHHFIKKKVQSLASKRKLIYWFISLYHNNHVPSSQGSCCWAAELLQIFFSLSKMQQSNDSAKCITIHLAYMDTNKKIQWVHC